MDITRQEVARIVGRQLRQIRQEAGLSQDQLAERANLDRTYPSLLERGQRQPTIAIFLRICDAVGQRPADIMQRISGALPAKL